MSASSPPSRGIDATLLDVGTLAGLRATVRGGLPLVDAWNRVAPVGPESRTWSSRRSRSRGSHPRTARYAAVLLEVGVVGPVADQHTRPARPGGRRNVRYDGAGARVADRLGCALRGGGAARVVAAVPPGWSWPGPTVRSTQVSVSRRGSTRWVCSARATRRACRSSSGRRARAPARRARRFGWTGRCADVRRPVRASRTSVGVARVQDPRPGGFRQLPVRVAGYHAIKLRTSSCSHCVTTSASLYRILRTSGGSGCSARVLLEVGAAPAPQHRPERRRPVRRAGR
jgi:hypothetical protein